MSTDEMRRETLTRLQRQSPAHLPEERATDKQVETLLKMLTPGRFNAQVTQALKDEINTTDAFGRRALTKTRAQKMYNMIVKVGVRPKFTYTTRG